ncbi:hypothetical protein [Streptomyces hydrogenans]|uniref:hypothetical protein n=1 Tax=Streptomyces hydrogenans TaxID=1873719 RepID=UPI00278C5B27|nr:hypothetical protein [Streptomyces hydrogenans]
MRTLPPGPGCAVLVSARDHTETLLADGEPPEHKLGIWYASTKQGRDKLTPAQRTALADLGATWA